MRKQKLSNILKANLFSIIHNINTRVMLFIFFFVMLSLFISMKWQCIEKWREKRVVTKDPWCERKKSLFYYSRRQKTRDALFYFFFIWKIQPIHKITIFLVFIRWENETSLKQNENVVVVYSIIFLDHLFIYFHRIFLGWWHKQYCSSICCVIIQEWFKWWWWWCWSQWWCHCLMD